MKVALHTLGCKLNQAETELMVGQLAKAGHVIVAAIEYADVYVLNTCTVTGTADAKCRQLLGAAHRRNPKAMVVVTGCYAQRAAEEATKIGGVNLVLDGRDGMQLVRLLEEAIPQSRPLPTDIAPAGSTIRTRSFVKIQDGCTNFCSYCIVPLVRGKETSVSSEEVLAQVKDRVNKGYQEIVLTGTKVGSYGYDGLELKGLLDKILGETGIARLRLSSLQPQEISPPLIELWKDNRLCPHFHLSLQSGSDSVLRRMNRRYITADYTAAVSLIRSVTLDAAITTDFITGFPGETDAEFQESYEFCRKIGFARIHVFPYSPRQGTLASSMPKQVAAKTKKERTQKMLALARESVQRFRKRFSGQARPVLWESQHNGVWSGLTDNYIRVSTRSNLDLTNTITATEVD